MRETDSLCLSYKMSVTGKLLYNKFCELRPDLVSGISPEILSEVCNESSTQPFLQWFCQNVSQANILSNDEIKMKNALQAAGEWLEDEALDQALAEATKDCPELLELVNIDDKHREDLFAEHEILKNNCEDDEDYIHTLRDSIKNLKGIENHLDDNIEEAEIQLDKERIETERVYDNVSVILEEFDRENYQLSKDIDILLNVYANAAKNQGNAKILWSQMPIDSFLKEIEIYNHHLNSHIRKLFGNSNTEEQEHESDCASLINNSKEKQMDEKMRELSLCKTNLTNSKIKEIEADVKEKSYMVMLQSVKDIYNDGNLKIPGNNKLQNEILTLVIKKDDLKNNIELLQDQLFPKVVKSAEMEILQILKNDALARLERRKIRFEKLKNLHSLAGEHGHSHVDLLCMLIEMQSRGLHVVAEFIADARHYITTEYEFSSTRCEIMQQQQDEYITLVTQSLKTYNVFNQTFISLMFGDDISDKLLSSALKRYNDMIAENIEKKKLISEIYLKHKMDKLQEFEDEINKDYITETQSGSTISLKPISFKLNTDYSEISTKLEDVQTDLNRIRNKFKELTRVDISLEREKNILWQRFLADPDTLRKKYKEAEQKVNECHFEDTLEQSKSDL